MKEFIQDLRQETIAPAVRGTREALAITAKVLTLGLPPAALAVGTILLCTLTEGLLRIPIALTGTVLVVAWIILADALERRWNRPGPKQRPPDLNPPRQEAKE